MTMTRATRYGKMRLAALATATAAAGLLVPAGQATAAKATPQATSGVAPKPTIVLEHGAWADGSSWDGVVSQLQSDGFTVYALPNPLRGLSFDSAYLADFLQSISGPIILVAHSYGGMVTTNAATGDSQVKALVYVDAFIPAQGQTVEQLVSAVPGSCAVPSNLTLVPYPGAPAGAEDAYMNQSVYPSCLANDLPASQAAVLAATQRPLSTDALTQQSGVPAWQTIPCWAVIGTADHAIPPAELQAMAQQADCRITTISGASHLSMISHPDIVTRVILDAVHATT
jgi:pimeloyl-ACP methyl ester carboxylesterase